MADKNFFEKVIDGFKYKPPKPEKPVQKPQPTKINEIEDIIKRAHDNQKARKELADQT